MADGPTLSLPEAITSECPGLLERLEAMTGERLEFTLIVHSLTEATKISIIGASSAGVPDVVTMVGNAILHVTTSAPNHLAVVPGATAKN